MNEWIPVIAAFTGALVAGLLSYRAASLRLSKEERIERQTIILEKLEETHSVARSIRQSYRETYGNTVRLLMTNESESKGESPVETDRLLMLVGFYFPDLIPVVEALERERKQFGAIMADSIVAITKPGAPRQALIDSLHQQYQELDAACDELLKATTSLARERLKL